MSTGGEFRVAAGVSFPRDGLPPLVETLDGVPRDSEQLYFRRIKSSHKGISGFSRLKRLWVLKAVQDMIEEISHLPDLEVLHIRGITATSLDALARNRNLKRLIILGGTKIENFDWVSRLPATLETLLVEDFSRISDIHPLGELTNLTTLGIEGGMTTHVRIETLEPLARLRNLRYLFLASARLMDKSLAPLRGLTQLERLECRNHLPDREFIELKNSLPNLSCDWIKMIDDYGSLRAGNAAMLARIKGR